MAKVALSPRYQGLGLGSLQSDMDWDFRVLTGGFWIVIAKYPAYSGCIIRCGLAMVLRPAHSGFSIKKHNLDGSEASYWIGFGDGRDAVQQFFLDLDLNNIVAHDVEEEEEGGDDGSPMGPMDDGVPAAASIPTKSATPIAPTTSAKDMLGPPAPMDSAPQLTIEENQGATPIEVVILTDAKAEAIPKQPLVQLADE
ncbi:hypothetical protein COCNU_01G014270 [Cocos nucifera]|uniref:Uncharacterized protein n=1 Tax=Cocos nucifera TaxID=13894 RepID=A0A8K0MVC9_COCNU|nr:hypothetical protein COCNU_01G014270 [Cocos nucifera]